MLFSPVIIMHLRIDYPLRQPFLFDRNGEPGKAVGCFDLIAVSPIVLGVLHFVVNDKYIRLIHQIEIAFPGNIV